MSAKYQPPTVVAETDPVAGPLVAAEATTRAQQDAAIQTALGLLQSAATAATDSELAAAVSTLTTALSGKQDSSTAATDSELSAAVSTINTSIAAKQDASSAATDSELAAAVATVNSAVALKQDAATAATDSELGAEATRATAAEAALTASIATPRRSTFSRLYVGGHSIAEGFQPQTPYRVSERFASKLARLLGVEEVNYAQAGSAVALDDSATAPSNPGGYATVLNSLRPYVLSGAGLDSADRTSAPYVPFADLNVLYFGANDLVQADASATKSVAMVKQALRALICRARAGGLFEDTHASVAYSGTDWSASTTSQTQASSGSYHGTTVTGAVATITVPADFPGGEIDIGTFANSVSKGALYTVAVDGTTNGTLDTRSNAICSAGNTKTNTAVYRVTGLAAGAHTITWTVTALESGAGAFFDYWQIAAPDKPLVLVPTMYYPQTTFSGVAHTATTGDFDSLNAALAALVAEFDSYVVLVDVKASLPTIAYGSPGSMLASDNVHPNDRGHSLIASLCLKATRLAPYIEAVAATAHWRQVAAATATYARPNGAEPKFNTNWSTAAASGFSNGEFSKDASGRVQLRGTIKKSAAGSVGETIFTLPLGYRPAKTSTFNVIGSDAAGFVQVSNAGAVTWSAGAPTTYLSLETVQFLADH